MIRLRLALVFALVALVGAPASAQSPAPPTPARSSTVSATADPAANVAAIQAAIDAAPSRGEVVLDGLAANGDIPIARTIFVDRPDITVRGVSGAQLRATFPFAGDMISTIVRRPGGVALSPDHFEASAPTLDGSIAWKTYAWMSKADTHFSILGTPLDQAAGSWGSVDRLTIDLCYRDDHLGQWYAEAGIIHGFAAFKPFAMYQRPDGSILCFFSTNDGVRRAFTFPSPHDNKPHRITVEIDLKLATVRGAVDGKWVAISPAFGAGFKPGLKFARNESAPFQIFANAGGANVVSDLYGGEFQATLFGLRIGTGLDYAPGAPGSAVARLDGKPLNDSGRYQDEPQNPSTIAWVPMDEDPSIVCASRQLCLRVAAAGRRRAYGYVLGNREHGQIANCSRGNIAIRDLGIIGGLYGYGVAIGNMLHSSLERLTVNTVSVGVGSYNFGANYGNTLRDLFLSGSDSALSLGLASGYLVDNLKISGCGRIAIRLDQSGMVFNKVWHDGKQNGPGESFARIRGGSATFQRVEIDIEGGSWPTLGVFDVDSSANSQTGWTQGITTGGIAAGKLPDGIPVYRLSGDLPGRLVADSAGYDGPARPVVQVLGKGWTGTLNAWGLPTSPAGDVAGVASTIAVTGRPAPTPAPAPAPSTSPAIPPTSAILGPRRWARRLAA